MSLILKGKVEEHRSWMRLSYGITLAGISLRLQMPLLTLAGLSEVMVYRTVAWSCWLPELLWWGVWGKK